MSFTPLSPNPVLASVLLALCGCAATISTQITPSPQSPVCQASLHGRRRVDDAVRADQKDVPAREAAAADGIARFFNDSGCFASVSLQRVSRLSTSGIQSAASEAGLHYDRTVAIAVREPDQLSGSARPWRSSRVGPKSSWTSRNARWQIQHRGHSLCIGSMEGQGSSRALPPCRKTFRAALAAGLQPGSR